MLHTLLRLKSKFSQCLTWYGHNPGYVRNEEYSPVTVSLVYLCVCVHTRQARTEMRAELYREPDAVRISVDPDRDRMIVRAHPSLSLLSRYIG